MKLDWFFFLMIAFTLLLILVQRADPKRRIWVGVFVLVMMELLRGFAVVRGASGEVLAGLLAALVLSGLFWVLIGRYNPPRTSDEIQVLGLDD